MRPARAALTKHTIGRVRRRTSTKTLSMTFAVRAEFDKPACATRGACLGQIEGKKRARPSARCSSGGQPRSRCRHPAAKGSP